MITTHLRPDGDAVGSLLGLGLALEGAGKTVRMVSLDGIPSTFRHLPGSGRVLKKPEGPYDLTIAVDCADHTRAGNIFDGLGKPGLNIDHHITNDKFAEINLIEAEQAATCAIVFDHLAEWGLALTPDIASALLTGIITDTLGFRTTSTTPHVLRQAAVAARDRRGHARAVLCADWSASRSTPPATGARDYPPFSNQRWNHLGNSSVG